MILAKGPIKKQNFRLLIAHMKFHQIYALLHAFMLPLMKVYIISAKMYQGFVYNDTKEWWKIQIKTDLLFKK